jgi:hypothetical protein
VPNPSKPEYVPLTDRVASYLAETGVIDNFKHAKNTTSKLMVLAPHADMNEWGEWCVKNYKKARDDGLTVEDAAAKVNKAYREYVEKKGN